MAVSRSAEAPTPPDDEPQAAVPPPIEAENGNSKAILHLGHLSDGIQTEHWLRLIIVLAAFLLLLATVAVGVRLLEPMGHTLLLFAISGLFAYALDPFVEGLRRQRNPHHHRQMSRAVSTGIVFTVLLLLMVAGGMLLSRTLAKQVGNLAENHVAYEAMLHTKVSDAQEWLHERNLNVNLEQYLKNPPQNVKSWGEAVAHGTVTMLEHLSKSLVEGIVVLLVTAYLLIYSEDLRDRLQRGSPARFRPYLVQWQNDMNAILGGFVRGQILLAIAIGIMAAVLCLAMKIKLWLLIGIFVCITSVIPVVGPFIGVVPAIIAALVSDNGMFSPVVRIFVLLIAFAVINEIHSKVLYPRWVGGALGLHEVLTLFVLFAGYDVAGLVGVLFAAPLVTLAVITTTQLYRWWEGLPAISLSALNKVQGREAEARGTP